MSFFKRYGGLMVAAVAFSAASARANVTFNFTPASGMSAQAIAGFQAAGQRWSNVLTDNVTVNLNINFTALSPGVLGSTTSTNYLSTYSTIRSALTSDATSATDAAAVSHLQSGSNLRLLLNRTSDDPSGAGSATPFVDASGANTSNIRLTGANAKALHLLAANNAASDASIAFSSSFNWDFDPSNGITANTFDFVGVATHEIGHVLGFTSGVDILDINSTGTFYNSDVFTYVSPLDLFRYSSLSLSNSALDWTADTRAKYFSVDGGATSLGTFSTGVTWGDGNQDSHWKDGLGLGIMDPTAAPGELLGFSTLDFKAMDTIGWDLSLPEPATLGLLGLGALALLQAKRKQRS